MRFNFFAFFQWFIFGSLLFGPWSVSAQSLEEIHVSSGKELKHSLRSYNKEVTIDGIVHGNLFCFGGRTRLTGQVTGNVTIVFGNLEVEKRAVIDGRIITIGSPYVGPSLGTQSLIELPLKDVFYPRQYSFFEQIKRSLARILFGFLMVSLFLFLKPSLVREAGLEIRTDWMPTFFAGTSLFILLAGSIMVTLLFFAHPIGPILFVALTVLAGVIALFGLVAVIEATASMLYRVLGMKGSFVHALLLSVIMLELLCMLPWVGHIAQWVVLILGFGATLLTRFGTNRGWFTRKKRVWPGGQ